MKSTTNCQYVILGSFGYKAKKVNHWTAILAEALPFDSEAIAITYINQELKSEHGHSPKYKVVEVFAQFHRTQFASFNMWQAMQLEKAVSVLSPSSVVTENWGAIKLLKFVQPSTKDPRHPQIPSHYGWTNLRRFHVGTGTLKEPGHPEVFTWVECVATPMQMYALALSVSKQIEIAHCDYKL